MKRKQVWMGLFLAAVVLLAAGCGGSAPATVEPAAGAEQETRLPVVAAAKGQVIAEGTIEPARWSALALPVGGKVVELAVEEGETVAAGAVLLVIKGGAALLIGMYFYSRRELARIIV